MIAAQLVILSGRYSMLDYGTVSIISTSNTEIGGISKLRSRCAKFERKNKFAVKIGEIKIERINEPGRQPFQLTQCYEA